MVYTANRRYARPGWLPLPCGAPDFSFEWFKLVEPSGQLNGSAGPKGVSAAPLGPNGQGKDYMGTDYPSIN